MCADMCMHMCITVCTDVPVSMPHHTLVDADDFRIATLWVLHFEPDIDFLSRNAGGRCVDHGWTLKLLALCRCVDMCTDMCVTCVWACL